ncbi:hypothetical protein GCM10023318_40250 [Nocardia callitridis]|uniref:Uncharacterized protein n=1 Tax=Nocardia callitridis TaxID=648753 RepID=A0ABP9KLW6_9NOCA
MRDSRGESSAPVGRIRVPAGRSGRRACVVGSAGEFDRGIGSCGRHAWSACGFLNDDVFDARTRTGNNRVGAEGAYPTTLASDVAVSSVVDPDSMSRATRR